MEVFTLDLNYLGIPQSIAAYLLRDGDDVVLIETGPASTLANLETELAQHSLKLSDIRHALVTHIHLDHAGAAGHLARHGTKIYVHEFGAKHLIDPARLIDSATRIYGVQMDRLWGRMIPVPAEQIVPVHDGDVINFGNIAIQAIQTPGHARHHHAFAIDDVCFAGDVAGITLPVEIVPEPPQGSFLAIPTPPPEFDLEAWERSIDRLQSFDFSAIYPTHFGRRTNVAAHLKRLKELIGGHARFIQHQLQAANPRETIIERYISWNRVLARLEDVNDFDFSRYVSTNLLTMNVDGMIRYWNKAKGGS